MKNLVQRIRRSRNLNQSQFAVLIKRDRSTVSKWESGERVPTGHAEIGALLRVAPPKLQAELLDALGIDDVTAFAADLLAGMGVAMGPAYQGYAADTSDEAARAAFERKFGYAPERVVRTRGGLLVGPVRE